MARITTNTLLEMKQNNEKIASLSAYDASFARILDAANLDAVLVGDTLGMVIQGQETTIPVTIDDIAYHINCVQRGLNRPLLIGDLPFMSYSNVEQAIENATILMQAGAQMIKLEGGSWLCDSVARLSECGIPVCGHLGLTPQSVHKIGGYKVQGRSETQAQSIFKDAIALQEAGAQLLVLECVPNSLAKDITDSLDIPTIGIGAGPDTDGQILVTYDMLGLSDRSPKFVRDFLSGENVGILGALKNFVSAVKDGSFPAPEHCYE